MDQGLSTVPGATKTDESLLRIHRAEKLTMRVMFQNTKRTILGQGKALQFHMLFSLQFTKVWTVMHSHYYTTSILGFVNVPHN